MQQNKYDKEPLTAVEAQRLAQEIAFGPIVFQVSRLMLKFGIFQLRKKKSAKLVGCPLMAHKYCWRHH